MGDFAWCPGMSDWGPLSAVLAPASVTNAAPPAVEEAPPEPRVAEPATEKQKAFFSYLGIAFSPELTKDQASMLVNDAMEDPKNTERLRQWNEDRLRLHPDLFGTEIQAKKENRANRFFELCQTEGAEYFTTITKAHCQVLVGFLDVKFPNWDAREAEAAWNYFYPAIAEKFPQLVQKQWRGKFHYAEGQKVAAEITRKAPTARLRKATPSPLAAVARGVVFGVLILGVLYLVHRTMQDGAGPTPRPEKPVDPAASVAAKPAEPLPQVQTQPAASAVEASKAAPADPAPANSVSAPAPAADAVAKPVATAAADPATTPDGDECGGDGSPPRHGTAGPRRTAARDSARARKHGAPHLRAPSSPNRHLAGDRYGTRTGPRCRQDKPASDQADRNPLSVRKHQAPSGNARETHLAARQVAESRIPQ